jgi:very-short-patch-repair endonuclease
MKKKFRATNREYDSGFEQKFHDLWKSHNPYPIVHHHPVHLSRKWEIDFCFPQEKIAIELQGYGTGHLSYTGMLRDYHKHNDLVTAGWLLLYFMSSDIKDEPKRTIETIERLLFGRNPGARDYHHPQERRPTVQPSNLAQAARRLLNQRLD